jgi:hypothetical protein
VISTHRNNDSSEDMGRELAASATGFSPLWVQFPHLWLT